MATTKKATKKTTKTSTTKKGSKDGYKSIHDAPLFTGGKFYTVKKGK